MPVQDVTAKTLQTIIEDNVGLGTTIMTDEFHSYRGLCVDYKHKRIGHLKKQYVKGGTHTQNIEGFWSQMKRGLNGTYHAVSPKHLERYCDEFSYKHNTRKVNDSQRFASALGQVDCRLTYQDLIGVKTLSVPQDKLFVPSPELKDDPLLTRVLKVYHKDSDDKI
jgi:transposase-like protein